MLAKGTQNFITLFLSASRNKTQSTPNRVTKQLRLRFTYLPFQSVNLEIWNSTRNTSSCVTHNGVCIVSRCRPVVIYVSNVDQRVTSQERAFRFLIPECTLDAESVVISLEFRIFDELSTMFAKSCMACVLLFTQLHSRFR